MTRTKMKPLRPRPKGEEYWRGYIMGVRAAWSVAWDVLFEKLSFFHGKHHYYVMMEEEFAKLDQKGQRHHMDELDKQDDSHQS